ncbi:MAG: hypothetical protein ACRD8O_19585 [Bryobacteraceae bacterium]
MRLPLLALLLSAQTALLSQTAVSTAHYDNYRTGANIYETILTPANVNSEQFGKLANLPVSGCVFAQPLYAPYVTMPEGTTRNLVIIATTTNTVYAYDADDYSLHFSINFGIPAPSKDFDPERGYYAFPDCEAGTLEGPVGIVSTPVIDTLSNALYFVANVIDDFEEPHRHRHFLHKISLTTGDALAKPVEITGKYEGVSFQSRYHLQRAALLLHNDAVYIAFGSHQDEEPYSGWMFAYDTELRQLAVMSYSPVKSGAGIWQAGGGPATDGRYVYLTTGNLASNEGDRNDNADSILQIDPSTLAVTAKTSFYPEANLWALTDLDLGSSRVIPIPGYPYAIAGSKVGDLFIVDRGGMALAGRFQAATRRSDGFDWTGIYNGLAFWNDTIYVWAGGGGFFWEPPFPTDTLKAFVFTAEGLALAANGQSDGIGVGYQGANIVVSANGNDPATGIVWAHVPSDNSPDLQNGYLRAYHATDFSKGVFKELWNNVDDEPASFAKFNQPLVANGKVFLPTFSSKVIVYGLTAAAR